MVFLFGLAFLAAVYLKADSIIKDDLMVDTFRMAIIWLYAITFVIGIIWMFA